MKFGLISDTHDNFENIRKAVQVFKDKRVEFVVHLGDFVSPDAVRLFKGLMIVGILGNNDGDVFRLVQAFGEIKGEIKGDFWEFEKDGLKMAFYHGSQPAIRIALAESGGYDVLFHGHTHAAMSKNMGKTSVINPGSAHGFGKKRQ